MNENEKYSNVREPLHECTENETISFNGKEIPEKLKNAFNGYSGNLRQEIKKEKLQRKMES
jgi:hypothetical protein